MCGKVREMGPDPEQDRVVAPTQAMPVNGRYAPEPDGRCTGQVCQKPTNALQQMRRRIALLLDHLVGTDKQRRRYREPERLGGFEVEDKLEFCWLLYWQISRFGAFENLIDIN